MNVEELEKIRKKANQTTIIESDNGQRVTTIPKAFADAKNWNGSDIIEWHNDERGGFWVQKLKDGR